MNRTLNIPEGAFTFSETGVITNPVPNVPTMMDWVYRHEGLQKAIYNHTVLIDAVTGNGDAYALKKKQDLNSIAIKVRNLFKLEFGHQLERGQTQEVAKEKALKFANGYKKQLLDEHEKQFPSDMSYNNMIKLLDIKKRGVERVNGKKIK